MAELPELSKFLNRLEDAPDLEPITIKATKIHKVLIAISKLDPIPGDEEFDIRVRCQELIGKWQTVVENHNPC